MNDILRAILDYNLNHVDHREGDTWETLVMEYQELQQHLQFPMRVYRGLQLKDGQQPDLDSTGIS